VTIVRAVRAGRARVRATAADLTIDGPRLRDLIGQVAAEARLVTVPGNHRPWIPTGMRVTQREAITWLAWGQAFLLQPIGVGVRPSLGLFGRVEGGRPHASPRQTFTFTADRDGQIEFGGRLPGELRDDGTIVVDRVPYGVMRGGFTVVVARWTPTTNPSAALGAIAGRDPSGLCAMEVARLTAPPQPPPGWAHHPLLGCEDVYRATANSITADCHHSNAIIRRSSEAPLTRTLRLRWNWRVDELPSRLPEDTTLSTTTSVWPWSSTTGAT
jgi:hypothetical protein